MIGLKSESIFSDFVDSKEFKLIAKKADYISYQAPVLSGEWLKSVPNLDTTKLLPHSVNLSTAHAKALPNSILKKLKEQCRLTEAPFLGEHIGLLNHNADGVSLGYLLPPALNEKSAKIIAKNVTLIQDYCELPLALENPVIYCFDDESTMNWPDFIRLLSTLLPKQTGWLIDFAHLFITAKNLGDSHLDDYLKAYRDTDRRVYEVHMANVHKDIQGVYHDSHDEDVDQNMLNTVFSSISKYNLFPDNFTIECDQLNVENTDVLLGSLEKLSDKYKASKNVHEINHACLDEGVVSIVTPEVRRKSEQWGRKKILEKQIRQAFPSLDDDSFFHIARQLGFEGILLLLEDFMSQPGAGYMKTSIPYFSVNEWDGVDIKAPFYNYVLGRAGQNPSLMNYLRTMLVDISVSHMANLAQLSGVEDVPVYLMLAEDTKVVKKGLYRINVDSDNSIVAEQIDSADFVAAGFYFKENGAIPYEQ